MAVRLRAARTEFTIIPQLAKFVKSFCENIYFFIFPKMLDFYWLTWYYNHVRRGKNPWARIRECKSQSVTVARTGEKKFSKTS